MLFSVPGAATVHPRVAGRGRGVRMSESESDGGSLEDRVAVLERDIREIRASLQELNDLLRLELGWARGEGRSEAS